MFIIALATSQYKGSAAESFTIRCNQPLQPRRLLRPNQNQHQAEQANEVFEPLPYASRALVPIAAFPISRENIHLRFAGNLEATQSPRLVSHPYEFQPASLEQLFLQIGRTIGGQN